MSIENQLKDLKTFKDLVAEFPSRSNGKRLHVSTLHRWRTKGLRGIHLEAVKRGGEWASTGKALVHFFEQVTVQANSTANAPSSSTRDASLGASRKLQKSGW